MSYYRDRAIRAERRAALTCLVALASPLPVVQMPVCRSPWTTRADLAWFSAELTQLGAGSLAGRT